MKSSTSAYRQATDVSVIPTAAVDRVEILLDGASAIYGSDAVGGVANIILKRDFKGLELSARLGTSTSGGYDQSQYNFVGGHNWGSGGFIVTGDLSTNSEVRASQRDFLSGVTVQRLMIYPRSNEKSALFSAHQDLGPAVELTLDAYYTKRDNTKTGANSSTVAVEDEISAKIMGASLGLKVDLPFRWQARLHGSVGRNEVVDFFRTVNITTGAQTSSGGSRYLNEAAAVDVGAEGPMFSLPGGHARLSLGGGWRKNTGEQSNPITAVISSDGQTRSYYGYAEMNLPFVGRTQNIPLVDSLSLNAAVRYEDYAVFGDVLTPKVGALWGLAPGLEIKASWGRSFKAPTVRERFQAQSLFLYPATTVGGAAAGAPAGAQVIYEFGGNPDLGPERATTITAGIAARPEFLPDFSIDVNAFEIRYRDRVGTPVVANQAVSNPAFAPAVVRNPTSGQISDAFAWIGLPAGTFTSNFANAPYDATKVFAIVYGANTNISADLLRGIDLTARYGFDALGGRASLGINGTWLLDAERRITSVSPTTPIAGVAYFPPKFRGQFTGRWSSGGLTLSSIVNRLAGITDTNITPNLERKSMTTVDFVIDYQGVAPFIGDIGVNLAVINAFNRRPPFLQPFQPYQVPYDSTNYSGLGRIVNFTVTKRF